MSRAFIDDGFAGALEKAIRGDMTEALVAAEGLSGSDRAGLALFCHSRAHLREKGMAMAGMCEPRDMIAQSSLLIAEAFLSQAAEWSHQQLQLLHQKTQLSARMRPPARSAA